MVLLHFTTAQFQRLGLELAGFEIHRQANVRLQTNTKRFRSCCGISPEACSELFGDFQTTGMPAARIDGPKAVHILMALNWLTNHRKEAELACTFKMDKKTARGHIWRCTIAIAALKGVKITLAGLDDSDEVFILTVDGVHFRILERTGMMKQKKGMRIRNDS